MCNSTWKQVIWVILDVWDATVYRRGLWPAFFPGPTWPSQEVKSGFRTYLPVHVCTEARFVFELVSSVWKHDRHFVKDKKQCSGEKEDEIRPEPLTEVGSERYEGGACCGKSSLKLWAVIIHSVRRGQLYREADSVDRLTVNLSTVNS